MKAIFKEQRVGLFVDVQNMYYSAKQLYSMKVNFANIMKKAVGNRKLIRAFAYVIKADIKEESNFFDALQSQGYDVKMKDLQVFLGGAKKGDWDVGIAMDIMRMTAKLDVIVLVSGDGDFQDLVEYAKALGCRVEVMAFGKTASSRLKNVADMYIDMENDKKTYLIQEYSASKRAQSASTVTSTSSAPSKSVSQNSSTQPEIKPSPSTYNRSAPQKRTYSSSSRSRSSPPRQSSDRRPGFSRNVRGNSRDRQRGFESEPISSLQRINLEQFGDSEKESTAKPVASSVGLAKGSSPQPDKKPAQSETATKAGSKVVASKNEELPSAKGGLLSKLKKRLTEKKT